MKSFTLILPILFILVSCDAPRRTLSPNQYSGSYTDNGNSGTFTNGANGGSGGGTTGGTTGGSGSNTGFEHCDMNNNNGHTIDIGHFSICQSTLDETLFKIKTTIASPSVRICLIPTFRNGSGSMPLGNPQCTFTQANTVINGKLYKDRAGTQNNMINGVIVMKEPLTPSYYGCMYAYVNWPNNTCSTNATYCNYWRQVCPQGPGGTGVCHTEPMNYMNQVCTAFKNTYSNSYADLATR